jgi:hypothetical protein
VQPERTGAFLNIQIAVASVSIARGSVMKPERDFPVSVSSENPKQYTDHLILCMAVMFWNIIIDIA